jgi:hypothetical protein
VPGHSYGETQRLSGVPRVRDRLIQLVQLCPVNCGFPDHNGMQFRSEFCVTGFAARAAVFRQHLDSDEVDDGQILAMFSGRPGLVTASAVVLR